jgi:HEAT repeat protein
VRAAAARALRDLGSESSVVLPELVAALGDSVADLRLAAIRAWGRGGAGPAGSRGVVIALLKDPDPRVREAASAAIDEDALKTGPAVAGLLAALKVPDADVRAVAAGRHPGV